MMRALFPRSEESLRTLDAIQSCIGVYAPPNSREHIDSIRSLSTRIQSALDDDGKRSEELVRRLNEIVIGDEGPKIEEENEKENVNTVNGKETRKCSEVDESPITETPMVQRPATAKTFPLRLKTPGRDPAQLVKLVTPAEFSKIPSYQRGRMTVDDLNAVLTAMQQLWKDNYTLLKTNPRGLNSNKLDARILLTTQSKEVVDGSRYFCTESDLRNAVDAKRRSLVTKCIQCLRHVSRVKYTRLKNSVVLISCAEG